MKSELLEVFKLIDNNGGANTMLNFVNGTSYARVSYWIKAHNWSDALSNFMLSEESKAIFKDFPQNENHELYPCDSNDASLSTALDAIAKDLKGASITWDTSTNKVSIA